MDGDETGSLVDSVNGPAPDAAPRRQAAHVEGVVRRPVDVRVVQGASAMFEAATPPYARVSSGQREERAGVVDASS